MTAMMQAKESPVVGFLGELDMGLQRALLDGSRRERYGPGAMMVHAYGEARLLLIHRGLAQVRALSRDGRSATVRYIGEDEFVGLPSTVAGSSPVGAQAVTECDVTSLNPERVRAIAVANAEVAWCIARELARMSYESKEFLNNSLFGSVDERVARHLLELARPTPDGLLVSVDQETLAHSIGSVREVVARALKRFREAGLVERVPGGLRIANPIRLEQIARATG